MPKSASAQWSDDELAASVEAYIYLLRLQIAGVNHKQEFIYRILLEGPLGKRNEASIRYRLRNISAVVEELGSPTLTAFSPARQVGRNVRERLRAMLLAHSGFLQLRKSSGTGTYTENPHTNSKANALERLASLRSHLDDVERELIGIGHNNPPEPLSAGGPARADFDRARDDIAALESEIRKGQPDTKIVNQSSSRLAEFGLKIALWVGERATKFTDTILKVAAPVLVAKAAGLLPSLAETAAAISRIFH